MAKIKPLVKAAKSHGFSALALTDTGALYGALEFYQACQDAGVKPIIGFEAFVAPRGIEDRDPVLDAASFPIILLAENYEGYRNLLLLSSEGHIRGFFSGRPRVDVALLRAHAKGVLALSGPIAGRVPSLLREGKPDEAARVAREYADIFGSDNFFLELEDHPAIPGQMEVNAGLIRLGRELSIPLVATRDVHYLNPGDAEAADVLACIRDGAHVSTPGRETYRDVDRSLNDEKDIASRFRHAPDAILNTGRIADRVNIEIPLNVWHFAPVDLPPEKTADDVLTERARSNMAAYYSPVPREVSERLEYELDIIKTKGYSPYFLCVSDYVEYAKMHGIVETTRGSAAGSLVSYVLGITTVDPIRFQLPFERFLNPFRPSPPDIDTDFADDRRDEMIAYVTEKYGADKVAQILTFGTMAARASVRDVGRALGFSYSFCDQVAKLIPVGSQGFPMTIERALEEEPDLKKMYAANPDVKRLIDLARKVEGCARHTSIHAAGVVIAPSPLTDFTPIQREVGGERITTQYDMKSVEAGGLLKMDFLGIRNLSILGKAVEFVEKTTGERIDIYDLPLDDQKTFDMLSRGETMGTFQLGGSGMTRWIKELRPTTIDDIMAMVALYRPGPMDSIPEYIRRKHNPSLVEYLDPRMKKHLGASFGLLVYQEDVLLTAIELAGYDWLEADKFRKAMGKKIPEEMAKQKEKFYEGCKKIGNLNKDTIDTLWRQIEPFAAYGFGKAHAASYGIVAYQTAYMKAHYPVQYMAAVLVAESGDIEKVAAIVHECRRMGIDVLPPDVNESFRSFAMVSKPGEPGRIRFGLNAIKNVGEHICDVLYAERKERGAYKNLEDLLTRVTDKDFNKKSLESLIQAGALDSFGHDRGTLLGNSDQMLAFMRHVREGDSGNQHSLFSGTSLASERELRLKDAPKATMEQKLEWEKNLLGLYVSSHPFAYYEEAMKSALTPIAELDGAQRGAWVIVGGVIGSCKKKITKKGEQMLFATIEDRSGSVELLVFPRTYAETKDLWKEGDVICIVGKTPKEEGDSKVFVEKALPLSKESARDLARQLSIAAPAAPRMAPRGVVIALSPAEVQSIGTQLKALFAKYPGAESVYIAVGANTIKAQATIAWNAGIEAELARLVGEGKVSVQ